MVCWGAGVTFNQVNHDKVRDGKLQSRKEWLFYPTIELKHINWDVINFTSKHKYDIYVLYSLWVPKGTLNNANGTMFQTSYKGTSKKITQTTQTYSKN